MWGLSLICSPELILSAHLNPPWQVYSLGADTHWCTWIGSNHTRLDPLGLSLLYANWWPCILQSNLPSLRDVVGSKITWVVTWHLVNHMSSMLPHQQATSRRPGTWGLQPLLLNLLLSYYMIMLILIAPQWLYGCVLIPDSETDCMRPCTLFASHPFLLHADSFPSSDTLWYSILIACISLKPCGLVSISSLGWVVVPVNYHKSYPLEHALRIT